MASGLRPVFTLSGTGWALAKSPCFLLVEALPMRWQGMGAVTGRGSRRS